MNKLFKFKQVFVGFFVLFFKVNFVCSEELNSASRRELVDGVKSNDIFDEMKRREADIAAKALILIAKFSEYEKKEHDYKKAKQAFDIFSESLNEVIGKSKVSQEVEARLIEVALNFATKYRDELLRENGIYLAGSYPGGYSVYFETLEKSSKFNFPYFTSYRVLSYKIKELDSHLSCEDLTNVELILQNRFGFEIVRNKVGKINQHGFATGRIEIKEDEYKEIGQAMLVTDQDRGYESYMIK